MLKKPNTVYLTWRPPKRRNGVIVSYIILYSKDDYQSSLSWREKQENGQLTHFIAMCLFPFNAVLYLSSGSSTAAYIKGLQSDATYLFKLRAKTSAGPGPPSEVLHVGTWLPTYQQESGGKQAKGRDVPRGRPNDRDLGIIIGVAIGGSCIVICIVVIVLRNRCFPPPPSVALGPQQSASMQWAAARAAAGLPKAELSEATVPMISTRVSTFRHLCLLSVPLG